MQSFATYFGILFQMRDDLMDFLGNTEVSRKTVHNDFRRGYYTMPAIYTFAHPQYGDALREIAERLRREKPEAGDPVKIQELITKSGGLRYTREKICGYIAKARESLAPFPATKAKDKLFELLDDLWATTPGIADAPA